MKFRLSCTLFIVSILSAVTAWSQASSTTVRGTVHDQAQAVVPQASVKLTNTDTNVLHETKTNEAGLYVFPGLTPGPYRLAVESPGMQAFEGALTVQVQQDAVVDVVLQLGQTATQVEVKDVTPMVQTDNPTLGHVLERQRIEQLPINGRGYQALLQTVPGIDSTGIPQAYGLRTNSSATLFDGAQVNEVWEGWDFGRPPGLDAISEVNVEVNNSSAKFARPTTIMLSSKSGTNQLHGSLFETNRNSGYGTARRRQDTFTKAPYSNRNEFGASMGAPVFIPKLYDGRNRTFFFAAWEANRIISNTTQQWSVPTEAMRNGDFRGLVDEEGRQYELYDPFTTNAATGERQRLAYRGVPNTIDPARISPVAKALFAITPLPTDPSINPLLGPNWIGPVARPSEGYTYSIRIDHRISSKDLVYGRYSYGRQKEEYQYPTQVMLNHVSGLTNRLWPNRTSSATWVCSFSPTLTNELIATGSRDYHRRGAGDYQTNYARTLGLPNPFQSVNWPTFDGLDLDTYGFEGEAPFYLITNFVQVQDNATKITGRHEFQFGFHSRSDIIDKNSTPLAGGFSFATSATSLLDPDSTPTNPQPLDFTGHGLANMYLGVADYNADFSRSWYHFRRQEFAVYLQDNWKVTPRLTLNLGLRYEMRSPLHDRDGTLITFDLDKRAYVVGTDVDNFIKRGATLPSIVTAVKNFGGNIISYKDAGLPQNLIYRNWKQLGPRLGFAYRAWEGSKAVVLRGGYRISYYPQKLQDWVDNASGSPPVAASFENSVTNTALSPDGLPNYGLRSVPKYIAGVNTPDSIIDINDTRALARGFNARFVDPHAKDGRIQDWNFTVEKEVMPNSVVRLAYVGNHTDFIQQYVDYNDATPAYVWYATKKAPLPTGEFASVATRPYDQQTYADVNLYSPTGYGNHHSFQVEFERRYSRGVGFQVFYRTANTLLTTRETDDTISPDRIPSINNYLPGTVPADLQERNRFLNYKRDPNTPKHQIRWNWIVDIPLDAERSSQATPAGSQTSY